MRFRPGEMPVEYHEIGTPRKEKYGVTCGGLTFVVREDGSSEWTGSIFESILRGDNLAITNLPDHTVVDTAKCPYQGCSVMHYAAASGNEFLVDFFLRKMHRPHDPDSLEGVRPLAIACRFGWSAIVRKLVRAGALISAVDRRGNTCMHECAKLAQNRSLEFLLETATTERLAPLLAHVVWLKNVEGATCYDVALAQGHTDTASLIMKYMRVSLHYH